MANTVQGATSAAPGATSAVPRAASAPQGTTSATPGATGATQGAPNTTSPLTAGMQGAGGLGQQDFLNLLVAQLKNQDPMKPMEDKEFITQLAQFSSLQAIQTMNQNFEAFTSASQLGQAAVLIGKYVQAGQADGTTVTGQVSEVRVANGSPSVVVNGQAIDLTQVVRIGDTADAVSGTTATNGSSTATTPAATSSTPTATARDTMPATSATSLAAPATAATSAATKGVATDTTAPSATRPAATPAAATAIPVPAPTGSRISPTATAVQGNTHAAPRAATQR